MSVPELLTPLIPEILARLRTSRKDRKLPMLRLCRKRREEDVGDARTTRSRDFAEGQGHAKTEVARLSGVSLRSVNGSRERDRWGMSMMPGSAPNDRLAGPARLRISGNKGVRISGTTFGNLNFEYARKHSDFEQADFRSHQFPHMPHIT
jgi:hypothetical protein